MQQKKIKLGFAPTIRAGLARLLPEVANRSKQMIEAKLKEWDIEYVGLDWLNEDGFLFDPIDAPRVAARFKAEGVDALFTPHCNFGTEAAVAILAREVGKPLLLWGPRDGVPEPDGERLQDSQCGLFATSAVLKRMGVPFTYIVNSSVESETFKRGFQSFLRAAAAAGAFLGARIGQVGTRPPGFWTMIENEGELLERWNIQVVPTTLVEISQAMMEKMKQNSMELKQTVTEFRDTADFSMVAADSVSRMAALRMVFAEFCQNNNLDALAIFCHRPFRIATGVPQCFVNGMLADIGIPVGCETDLHGVLTSLMSQAATLYTQPIIFADLTIRHPENENAELLWHCGNFPPSLAADPSARKLRQHDDLYAAGNFEIKGGDVTISRLGGDHGRYSLFMGEAKGTKGPYTYGTYLWVEMANWPKWEQKLMYGPYIHHVAAVHGHLAPVLYEACKYIPGLEPDPVEPTAEEIQAYWRGEDLRGR